MSRRHRTEAIAHRGASSAAPENTLAAFRRAIEAGADRIEFDVLLTRDLAPGVIHDAALDRTTDGRGPVASVDLAELKRLDAGAWLGPEFAGERVPTLDEALELCAGRIAVNVEIKEEAVAAGPIRPDGIEAKVMDALRRAGALESATVSSFATLALERVRELEPRAARELLWTGEGRPPSRADLERASESGFRSINVSREELWAWPGIVEAARDLALGVKVYTVDDEGEMRRIAGLGAAGIFTNRPEALVRLLRAG